MGGFALPALPSLSSFQSLLNTSPPLIYSSSANPTQHHRSRSRSTSIIPIGSAPDTPTRQRPSSTSTSTLLPASPSANEALSNLAEWEPVRRSSFSLGERDRDRDSHRERERPPPPLFDGSPSQTPPRPGHRRAQSVVPRPRVSPLGRLHEISRNPMASVSAISLPTLAEMDHSDQYHGNDHSSALALASMPPSPLVRPWQRRQSKSSLIEPPSPISLYSNLPEEDCLSMSSSSRSGSRQTPPDQDQAPGGPGTLTRRPSAQKRGRSFCSIPPPPPHPNSIHTMPPPSRPFRPPPSPRSQSATDVRPPSASVFRRSSISSTTSTSCVSDVAVMAKWSFPNTPPKDSDPNDGLKERLKHLSLASSTSSSSSSSSCASMVSSSAPVPPAPKPLYRSSTSVKPNKGAIGHRHTHSSPIIFPPPPPISISGPTNHTNNGGVLPLPPPPRPLPGRKPTTSRLRNPNPLCMPTRPSFSSIPSSSNIAAMSTSMEVSLSSSPGSMTSCSASDDTHGPSSIEACPVGPLGDLPSPSNSIVSLPPQIQHAAQPVKGNERVWWAGKIKKSSREDLGNGQARRSVLAMRPREDSHESEAKSNNGYYTDSGLCHLGGRPVTLEATASGGRSSSEFDISRLSKEDEEDSDGEQYLTLDDI